MMLVNNGVAANEVFSLTFLGGGCPSCMRLYALYSADSCSHNSCCLSAWLSACSLMASYLILTFFSIVSFVVQEIARVMQGVEIFIAMLAASPSYYNFMSVDFYTCLTEDNLLDQCATIVARIVDSSTGTSRRGRRNRTGNDTNSTLKMYRLDSEKFKDKLRKY